MTQLEERNGLYAKKLGNETIFEEQARCANEVLDIFDKNEGPPLLVAQMQQGKTGVALAVIDQFINNCKLKNLTFEVIFLTNIADNVLRDQTDDRLAMAGFRDRDVRRIHHGNLRDDKVSPDKTVQKRLIVIDECHIALEKSTSEQIKPFHEFLKKCGIEYGKHVSTWPSKDNYVLSISATPYAHIIQTKLNEESFAPVALKVSDKYYGLSQMMAGGRFHKSEQVVKNGRVTDFFRDRMEEFLESCRVDGGGHMIVRAQGASAQLLKDYIEKNYPEADARIYESSPMNNIPSLDKKLSISIPTPSVAIIRGSMRAGKTLTTTSNIRSWIEPPSSKTDTMCQVVGRCLGFEMINGENRRFQDKFPIYCNIREIEMAIEFYAGYQSIPSGVRNDPVKGQDSQWIQKLVFLQEPPLPCSRTSQIGAKGAKKLTSLLHAVLEERYRGMNMRCIRLDGPSEFGPPEFREREILLWEQVNQKYPQIKNEGPSMGGLAYIIYEKQLNKIEVTRESLDENVIFME